VSDKAQPYRCTRCIEEGSYTGSLRFPGDPPPVCRNHGKDGVEMDPVNEEKE